MTGDSAVGLKPTPINEQRFERRYDRKQWLSAAEAVHLLAPIFGGDEGAKATIISRIREGYLDGWAVWVLEEADIGAIEFEAISGPSYKPIIQYEGRRVGGYFHYSLPGYGMLPLDANFMAAERDWQIDEGQTDWESGVFVAKKPAPQHSLRKLPKIEGLMRRKVVAGLEFRLSDIENLAGKSLAPDADAGVKKSKGGRPPDEVAWTSFWLAVIDLQKSGRLNKEHFNTQSALRVELSELIGGALQPDTLIGRVRQIWDRFIEPSHGSKNAVG